jgi:hypothetical protein
MVAVISQLILNKKKDKNTTGHPDGQSADIDKGKGFVPQNIPKSNFQIIT